MNNRNKKNLSIKEMIEYDLRIIEASFELDSNDEKTYTYDHFFYGKKQNLKLLSQKLKKEKFKIDHLDKLSLIVSKKHILDNNEISYLENIAQGYDVEYDGWGSLLEE